MGLAEIAAGIEVTDEQRDRGVASVDRTATSLADRLTAVAGALPCNGTRAAALVEAYAAGKSVGDAGRAAGIAPTTAAKTLHLCGEQVCPLTPRQRDILEDWLDGRLARSEARQLTDASEREFALATYVATHDTVPEAREALEGALTDADATAEKQAVLGDSVDQPSDLVSGTR
ncbi:hypothetical protein BRC91_12720 [Halobacteriales archaeon QS_4_62_28]|nr:MAG: hypothetical protein BRC91_12720 [Halobacteriales archaeon QS_4_62_28]